MATAKAWEANHAKEPPLKSDASATKRAPRANDAYPTPKRRRTNKPVDKSGPLVYTGDQKLMPSPPIAPQGHVCATNAHDGLACHHQDCKFIHKKDVTKWPQAAFTGWKKLVETTPRLSWNPALVKAKVLGLKLTKQNRQVMDPSSVKK